MIPSGNDFENGIWGENPQPTSTIDVGPLASKNVGFPVELSDQQWSINTLAGC